MVGRQGGKGWRVKGKIKKNGEKGAEKKGQRRRGRASGNGEKGRLESTDRRNDFKKLLLFMIFVSKITNVEELFKN